MLESSLHVDCAWRLIKKYISHVMKVDTANTKRIMKNTTRMASQHKALDYQKDRSRIAVFPSQKTADEIADDPKSATYCSIFFGFSPW